MSSGSNAKEMIQQWLRTMSGHGRLDADELEHIVDIALEDGVMDEDEKAALMHIIAALDSSDFDTELWDKVEHLVLEYDLDKPA